MCEFHFYKVLNENLKCAWIKLLLQLYLTCSVKPTIPTIFKFFSDAKESQLISWYEIALLGFLINIAENFSTATCARSIENVI